MAFFKRDWTPAEADEWRREDVWAIVFSVLAYFFLTVGSALSFLLLTEGFIILALGIIMSVLMYKVIDPKLRVISEAYESKQKEYLHQLDEIQKWEAEK